MSVPTVPIARTARDHPRFNGDEDNVERPATKKIDTEAARERIASARTAARASDKPPGRPRKSEPKAPAPVITYTNGMFRAPITALYEQAGGLISYVAYPVGVTTQQQAAECGNAWDELAKSNPAVRKWLHSMTRTGAWGKLFAAHLPIFMTALMTFSPSFRDRMGTVVADSIDAMTQSEQPVQDPN